MSALTAHGQPVTVVDDLAVYGSTIGGYEVDGHSMRLYAWVLTDGGSLWFVPCDDIRVAS